MDWLKHHEFLIALIGAVTALATLVSKPARGTGRTVRVIILFFVFALEATIALSPAAGVGTQIFSGLTAFVSLSGSFMAWFQGDDATAS
jgi:hypothetical protein